MNLVDNMSRFSSTLRKSCSIKINSSRPEIIIVLGDESMEFDLFITYTKKY